MDNRIKKLQESVKIEFSRTSDSLFSSVAKKINNNNDTYSYSQLFAKRGRHRKSLRNIYEKHGKDMKDIFPVHLTTPEVICTLYEGQLDVFDLVIIDEASQIEVYDAIGCLFKGKSIVVAGDEHQMPPSRYFQKAIDSDELDENKDDADANIAVESILGFCRQSPAFESVHLDFHYRSFHHLLIAFSNNAIYSRLVVRPDSNLEFRPILFHHCAEGIWFNQTNEVEIERVCNLISKLDLSSDVPKVLVVTLNAKQRIAIIKALQHRRYDDDAFNVQLGQLEDKGFAIKNLENLQGDECEILILSTGYGPTPSGKFSRSYGQLNRKNIGYRLLNVLITRARYQVHVVTSIPKKVFYDYLAELDSTFDRGLFHAYLAYAESISNGNYSQVQNILNHLSGHCLTQRSVRQYDQFKAFESPFEEEVFEFLSNHFSEKEIEIQESQDQFRIDMVLRPRKFKQLKIAIECDGAKYHSGWANQISDLHREKLLCDSGYEMVRIWGANWYRSQEATETQLLEELNTIIRDYEDHDAESPPTWIASETDFEYVESSELEFSSMVDLEDNFEIIDGEEEVKFEQSGNFKSKDSTSEVIQIDLFSDEGSEAYDFEEDVVNDNCQVTFEVVSGTREGDEIKVRIVPRIDMIKKVKGISFLSPEVELARALKWKKEGDTVRFRDFVYQLKDVVQFD